MMNDVAERILIEEDPSPWLRGELEPQQALAAVASRLHPRLHRAFADWGAVGKPVDVPNDVLSVRVHDAIADSSS
jgi:hypothetical protein